MSVLQMEDGCSMRKGYTPQNSKTSQAILVGVMTAPSDENPNSGNTVICLGAAVLSTKLLYGNLRSYNQGKMSILAQKEVGLLRFLFKHSKQGIQVITRMVRKFTKKLMPELCIKFRLVNDQCVRCVLHQFG